MTVQEYLGTLDAQKLFEVYYDNYCGKLSDGVTKEDEEALFIYSIHKMLTMKVYRNPDAVMSPISYLDDEPEDGECAGEGQWVGRYWHRIVTRYEMQYIQLSDIRELAELHQVTDDPSAEIEGVPYESYAYDFMEELLFFDYDEDTHDARVEEETTEIKRRVAEAEGDLEAHCIPADMDEIRKTCGIITKEDEDAERRFYDEMRRRNYDHRVDVYNRLERPALEKIIKQHDIKQFLPGFFHF